MLATVWHCPPANRRKEWGEGKGGEGERKREGKHQHSRKHQHRGEKKIEEERESISVVYTPHRVKCKDSQQGFRV
jgi:hypothetical protein